MKWRYYYRKFCGETDADYELRRKDPAPMTEKEIALAEWYFRIAVLPCLVALVPLVVLGNGIREIVYFVKGKK